MEQETVLSMENISKGFNGIPVLKDISFSLEKGEVHALMGGNGAGKSTLMKILTGIYAADSGKIFIDGKEVEIKTPEDARRNYISMIFQEFSLIPTLTVAQNVFLTRESKKGNFLDDKSDVKKTEELLKELEVDIKATDLVGELGVGYWQMTEIAKALSQETKILVMDEPTSSLTKKETEVLFEFIEKLKKKGYTIVYISHRMEEIFQVCDRITILRDGRIVATENIADTNMETVISHIIGSNLNKTLEYHTREYNRTAEPMIEIKNLNTPKLSNINLKVVPGEILGLAGLMGSGRTELARAIFGIDPITSGEILIQGKARRIRKPKDAIKAGIALIPEDRRIQGLVLAHSVKDNICLPQLDKLAKPFLINDTIANAAAKQYVERLRIKTDNIHKLAGLLSGGNQQKIVLAKWLANHPDILILDEPTIGVDIQAKTEILDIVRELADSGKSIIIISSELPELLAVSDRLLVMHGGTIVKEYYRQEINKEEELQHAIQGF
ncbi:sugar ABC transporter ATP-binding protein [Paenibacillus polymyxa]|uniref:sugar ABC transporter ATP-binding protein n=1 Tax=Paenibacillus polymyxa TaxID=1406 RepID=UPI002B417315|nr:sugar ABC transporter ATP-binding protein [Paenibacillus polymyxa]